MARMIPKYQNKGDFIQASGRPSDGVRPRHKRDLNGLLAEWSLYQELQKLPDDFTVLHSWRFAGDLGESVLCTGEADFVVLGPEGVLVIEVKNKPIYTDNGFWRLETGKLMKNPFAQASRNLDGVVANLRGLKHEQDGSEIRWREPDAQVRCIWAVAFPGAAYDRSVLPCEVDDCQLIDSTSLRDGIEKTVKRLFEHQSRFQNADSFTGLTPWEIQQAARVLTPELTPMIGCDGPVIAANSMTLKAITNVVMQSRSGLGRNFAGAWSIERGVAGSGKTLFAQLWARQAAQEGKRTLLLCFNRMLAEFLKLDPNNRAFDIFSFHGLSAQRSQEAGISYGPVGDTDEARREFYDNQSPQKLLEATRMLSAEERRRKLYDVVIVDEAQDIRLHWWDAIQAQLEHPEEGELHVLLDEEQRVFGKDTGFPEELKRKLSDLPPLTLNVRNTRRIVEFTNRATGSHLVPSTESPSGLSPRVDGFDRKFGKSVLEKKLGSLLDQLIRHDSVHLSQIVVLCDHAYGQGKGCILDGCGGSIGGVPIICEKTALAILHAWQHGEGLLVTTPRSFKGLEADVVILAGMSGFREETFMKSDLYVAMTRAKSRLFAICENGEVLDCLIGGKANSGDS